MVSNMNPSNRRLFQRNRFLLRDKDLTEDGAFYLFPLLPTETQNQIWVLSLTPRLVEIQYYAEAADDEANVATSAAGAYVEDYDPSWEIHYYSIAPLPAAFYVSKESRDAVINRYSLCFASESSPAAIYFNFELDTVFLDKHFHAVGTRFMECLSDAERHGITRLAVDEDVLSDLHGPILDKDEMSVFRMELLSLPKVTELTFTSTVFKAFGEGNDGEPKEEAENFGDLLDDFFYDPFLWAEMYTDYPAEIVKMEMAGLEEVPNIWLMWVPSIVRTLIKQHAPKRAWIWRRGEPPASV